MATKHVIMAFVYFVRMSVFVVVVILNPLSHFSCTSNIIYQS